MSIGNKKPTQVQEPTQVQDTSDEHRISQRQRQFKRAKLIFNNDQSVIDCVLRDISATGARVRLKGLFDGPKQIVLKVSDNLTYSADVMWNRNNELGLRFHGEAKLEMAGKLTAVQSVLDQAKALPVDGLLRSLSTYHDFAADDVKSAGEELTAAQERMIEALRVVLHSEKKKLGEEQ